MIYSYAIVDENKTTIKTVVGYRNAKRSLDELNYQQQSKKVQKEYKLIKLGV